VLISDITPILSKQTPIAFSILEKRGLKVDKTAYNPSVFLPLFLISANSIFNLWGDLLLLDFGSNL
jgi:hypothetical protein